MPKAGGACSSVQGLRGSFAERLLVDRCKPAELIEAKIGRDFGYRRLTARGAQRELRVHQALAEHPSLGAHPVDTVEGVPQSPLADPGNAAQPRNWDGVVKMGPNISLGALHDRPAGGRPPGIPGLFAGNGCHVAHGTVEVPPKELRELAGLAVNFDRGGAETFTETLVSGMMQPCPLLFLCNCLCTKAQTSGRSSSPRCS